MHKAVLTISTICTITRPLLQYLVCPELKKLNFNFVDKYCDTATQISTILPLIIGGSYSSYSYMSNPTKITHNIISNMHKYVLPAGLGMITANSFLNPDHLPSSYFFIFGTVKSSIEMTVAAQIAHDYMAQDKNADLFSLSNPILAGAITSINVAQSSNALYYYYNNFRNTSDSSALDIVTQASNYALSFSLARTFYQLGSICQDENLVNKPLVGAGFFFLAPVFRGFLLSFSKTGSVTIPGDKSVYLDNILDGVAIASTSVANKHLANYLIKAQPNELNDNPDSVIKAISSTIFDSINFIGAGNTLSLILSGLTLVANVTEEL